jgi:hypothetical protein
MKTNMINHLCNNVHWIKLGQDWMGFVLTETYMGGISLLADQLQTFEGGYCTRQFVSIVNFGYWLFQEHIQCGLISNSA